MAKDIPLPYLLSKRVPQYLRNGFLGIVREVCLTVTVFRSATCHESRIRVEQNDLIFDYISPVPHASLVCSPMKNTVVGCRVLSRLRVGWRGISSSRTDSFFDLDIAAVIQREGLALRRFDGWSSSLPTEHMRRC